MVKNTNDINMLRTTWHFLPTFKARGEA